MSTALLPIVLLCLAIANADRDSEQLQSFAVANADRDSEQLKTGQSAATAVEAAEKLTEVTKQLAALSTISKRADDSSAQSSAAAARQTSHASRSADSAESGYLPYHLHHHHGQNQVEQGQHDTLQDAKSYVDLESKVVDLEMELKAATDRQAATGQPADTAGLEARIGALRSELSAAQGQQPQQPPQQVLAYHTPHHRHHLLHHRQEAPRLTFAQEAAAVDAQNTQITQQAAAADAQQIQQAMSNSASDTGNSDALHTQVPRTSFAEDDRSVDDISRNTEAMARGGPTALFGTVDTNHDGLIDGTEFKNAMDSGILKGQYY